jgi:hypothetical protein
LGGFLAFQWGKVVSGNSLKVIEHVKQFGLTAIL